MMEFSWFSGFYSNQPELCSVDSWEKFVDILRTTSEVEGYKPAADDYDREHPLISPAIYAEKGLKRSNNNVSGWDMLFMDIDDTTKSLAEIEEHFKLFENLLYSSPSCTKEKLKLRVIIPFTERVPKEHVKEVWYAAQLWCGGMIDEQTKDVSRMYYIPSRYTNKGEKYLHFFKLNKGVKLDWRKLIERWPMPPEEDRFKKSNPLRDLKRKIFLSNQDCPCMDIESPDCPFVYDSMIKDYMLTPVGGHHRALYQFMLKICYNAQKINYPISKEEIMDMGKQLDDMDGGFYDESKLESSARRAMEWVGE